MKARESGMPAEEMWSAFFDPADILAKFLPIPPTHLRIAEFGFFGVRVITCRQTPRRNGARSRAGDLLLYFNLVRPLRTS